jgi:hypothetical protein
LPSRTLNHVPVTAIDARMDDGATFEHELEAGANAFLLVLEGSAIVGRQERPVASGELAWLTRTDEAPSLVTIKAGGGATHLLPARAKACPRRAVFGGPFVMNTQEQIDEAFADFRAGPMRTEARAVLTDALRDAHHWLDELSTSPNLNIESLAAREGKTERWIRRTISLAFLCPALLDRHFAEPTAIRTNLGAIFVSLELSRSTWWHRHGRRSQPNGWGFHWSKCRCCTATPFSRAPCWRAAAADGLDRRVDRIPSVGYVLALETQIQMIGEGEQGLAEFSCVRAALCLGRLPDGGNHSDRLAVIGEDSDLTFAASLASAERRALASRMPTDFI